MLVLSRRQGEQINIGDGIVVTLVSIHGNKVRVGIEAPRDISVRRNELDETVSTNSHSRAVRVRNPR